MKQDCYRRLKINGLVLASLVAAVGLICGCTQPEAVGAHNFSSAPLIVPASACIDVEGKVSGDIIPNATVYLYRSSNLNFTTIMTEIRTTNPFSSGIVNKSKKFRFQCLSFGNYTFVIPTTSYTWGTGSPLPYEFECKNVSVRIAFQGGDYQYAVGAFSIEPNNQSPCTDHPLLCKIYYRPLQRECSLE